MINILINLFSSTILCYIIHNIFKMKFNYDSDTSYFLLHFIFNTIMVYYTYQDTIFCFLNPLKSMTENYSNNPTSWLIGFHLSHILTEYKKLSIIDWLHHFFSVFLICFINLYYFIGPILNLGIFFTSGLPGGLNYLCLYLVKTKIIKKETEKIINCYLNILCRMPGIIYWMSLSWICWITNNIKHNNNSKKIPLTILLLEQFFLGGNAVFFGSRVLINYGKSLNKNKYIKINK